MKYKRIMWEEYPSVKTPINALNLNHMDQGISELSDLIDDIQSITSSEINDVIGDGSSAPDIDINAEELTFDDIDSLFY
ncbi:MAG: hypothetical protein NC093_09075 [Alistipes sp.]|nr:hypothetical protein [Alistipes sp.]